MRHRTRPPVVQDAIVERVRSEIISGRLRPGDRLPPRSEVARRFSTTSVTVQRAFARLVESGFVTVRGPKGTFVSERPPHAYRYVLAFPLGPGDPGWVRFWTVLAEVAREASSAGPRTFVVACDVNKGADSAEFRALLEDVRERRLAGIVFATNPFLVRGTPLLEATWLPRVAIMPPPAPEGVIALDLDHGAFLDRALDALAERKRTRVAFITVPGVSADRFDALAGRLSSRAMAARKEWVQVAPQSDPAWAENLARLMFRGAPKERPDGLVITDDNLVEHASRGIVEAGVRVPDELDVIAHCNFPAPAPSVLPVRRLGYDIRALLRACVELLERKRRGEAVADSVVKPVFESELPAAGAPDDSHEAPRPGSRRGGKAHSAGPASDGRVASAGCRARKS